jgi:CheY-like chemotaxis protein
MCSVLLVEDNQSTQAALAGVLEWEGFKVVTASHGEEARQHLLAGLSPCIVILDLLMPVMDGWAFLDWAENTPYRDVPVVLITSLGLDPDVVQLACRRRCRVLAKSGDPQDLIDEVRRCCPAHVACG